MHLARKLSPVVATLLVALGSTAFGQTATTTPVGFISVTLPAASSPSAPSNATVSIPLYNSPDFIGTVSSVDSATQFTLTGANFANLAPALDVANPRLVRVKTSGTSSHVGKFFSVTAASGNQLTVSDPTSGVTNIAAFVSAGDTCEIVPAITLAKLFGPNAANASTVFQPGKFFVTGASASDADNVLIWNGATWSTYYNNNSSWRLAANFQPQNNVIIYPDEGIFIIHRDTVEALSLTLLGTVPSTAEQTVLAGAGSTFIPNRFPSDTTLLASGIHLTPGWVTAASAADADNVFIWEGSTWGTYFHNGTSWRRSANFQPQDSKPIPAGTAIFVTKASASATLSQPLPYPLN